MKIRRLKFAILIFFLFITSCATILPLFEGNTRKDFRSYDVMEKIDYKNTLRLEKIQDDERDEKEVQAAKTHPFPS